MTLRWAVLWAAIVVVGACAVAALVALLSAAHFTTVLLIAAAAVLATGSLARAGLRFNPRPAGAGPAARPDPFLPIVTLVAGIVCILIAFGWDAL
jgi:hypothetical protein